MTRPFQTRFNRTAKPKTTTSFFLTAGLVAGCSVTPPTHAEKSNASASEQAWTGDQLFGFEEGKLPSAVKVNSADAKFIAQDGSRALQLNMHSSTQQYSGISLTPDTPWDWSMYQDFSIKLKMTAPGDRSTQMLLIVRDGNGASFTRSIVVSNGPMRTYYCKLDGHDLGSPKGGIEDEFVELNLASGLRSNPPTWQSDDVQFAWMWGTKNLDLSKITSIDLSTMGSPRDKQVVIDNIRIEPNPPQDRQYLTNLVDRFGQNAKLEFDGKIHNDAEFTAKRDAELSTLNGEAMPDRSRFGGWKNGPKLEATGRFRTAKHNGRWRLVDPDGYLYFAAGIAVVRLESSNTMTGYGYMPAPNRESLANHQSERFIASDVRADMFGWLPDKDSPLAKAYGYARGLHSGALKEGEMIDFYRVNLIRKYGLEGYEAKWREVTVNRMLNWGFTSLGNWTDPAFYTNTKVPFFANAWINGDYKTVSSGNDFWAPLPDPFDLAFAKEANKQARIVAKQVQDSPWCVGVFMDNEMSFGRGGSNESLYGIVIHTLGRNGADSPTKAAFTKALQKQYASIDKLNQAWSTDFASWKAFNTGIDSSIRNDQQVADYDQLLELYASKYYQTVSEAIQKHMPGMLYMGSRLPDWGRPMPVIRASAKHCDVITYNQYKEHLFPAKWAFLNDIDKPSMIGEYQIGAVDAGHFHFGIVCAQSQEERAQMYTEYMDSVIDNPYMVGAHWFQYADSPITGRVYDGENYNNGFVNVTDTPYQPLVEAAQKLHKDLYPRLAE